MRYRYFLFVLAITALLLWGGTAITAGAEVTTADITVEIRNSGSLLTGEAYAPTKVGGVDYFEFDYIDGMALTLKGNFSSALGTYVRTDVYKLGVLQSNSII
ncbi:MAG: hypothetical protein EOM87_04920, partial [Clostridia bacterium]|nr:hypothetical protein [Clostridia bacterium]